MISCYLAAPQDLHQYPHGPRVDIISHHSQGCRYVGPSIADHVTSGNGVAAAKGEPLFKNNWNPAPNTEWKLETAKNSEHTGDSNAARKDVQMRQGLSHQTVQSVRCGHDVLERIGS